MQSTDPLRFSDEPELVSRCGCVASARRAGQPLPRASALTALLVDDSEVIRVMVARMLETAGMNVVVAADGLEAIRCVEAQNFDVVLMDTDMPVLDGMEAARRIRAREVRLGLPPVGILSISGSTAPADHQQCTEAGMSGILGKPFTSAQLMQRILCLNSLDQHRGGVAR